MDALNVNHWNLEDYKQVVTKKEAQEILRNRFHIINGRNREFKIKHLGVGMYEVFKKPLGDK